MYIYIYIYTYIYIYIYIYIHLYLYRSLPAPRLAPPRTCVPGASRPQPRPPPPLYYKTQTRAAGRAPGRARLSSRGRRLNHKHSHAAHACDPLPPPLNIPSSSPVVFRVGRPLGAVRDGRTVGNGSQSVRLCAVCACAVCVYAWWCLSHRL